jgi:hypothetical protein
LLVEPVVLAHSSNVRMPIMPLLRFRQQHIRDHHQEA